MVKKYRRVENLPILCDIGGNAVSFIKDFDSLTVEKVLNAERSIGFTVYEEVGVGIEREIIYKGERYIISDIEDEKTESGLVVKRVEGISAYVELGGYVEKGEYTVTAVTVSEFVEKLLMGTDWNLGVVESLDGEDPKISISEEDSSKLSLLRLVTVITDYELEFDTVEKTVSYVRKIGKDTGEVFRYGKNLTNIKRVMSSPIATVIYPYGKDGLSIGSVNGGKEYIENYSYYTEELGLSIEEARTRYRKEEVRYDDRFLYAGNLMRNYEKVLDELSKPIITYQSTVLDITERDLKIGDYVNVIDDDIGIRVRARVMRIVEKLYDEVNNEVELSYLPNDLSNSGEGSTEGSGGVGNIGLVTVRNSSKVTIGDSYIPIIEVALSTYKDTNIISYVTASIKSRASGDLVMYLDYGGVQLSQEYKEKMVSGYSRVITIHKPIIQIPAGSKFLRIFAKVGGGKVEIEEGDIEITLNGEGILGGESANIPAINIVEEVEYRGYEINEEVKIELGI